MTDQIKISEVSAILKQELAGLQATIHMEEVGTVLQVSGLAIPAAQSFCQILSILFLISPVIIFIFSPI